MEVVGGGSVRRTAPSGMFRGITGTGWVNVLEFWVRTTPPYSSVARPIAASFSGQLWTRTWRARVTAVPGRPRSTAPRRLTAGSGAGSTAAGRRTARGRRGCGARPAVPPGLGGPPAQRAAPPARGIEPLAHRGGQLRLVEVPDDPAPLDEADLLVLLGDHDDEGIGLLGDAEGGPMAGAEALGVDRHLREREQGAGGQDRVAADDHGAVVQRGPRREDRAQEVRREVAVDHHAGLGHLLEPGLALDDDEGAMALGRQGGGGARHLVRDVLGDARVDRRQQPRERADPADALKGAAQLGLEDDDEGEQADDGAALQDPRQQDEVERDRQEVDDDQDADPDDESDGTGPADQAEEPVDEERGDADVDHRAQVHLSEDRSEELGHRGPSVASGIVASASALKRSRRSAERPRGTAPRPSCTGGRASGRRPRGRSAGPAGPACPRPPSASRGRGRAP